LLGNLIATFTCFCVFLGFSSFEFRASSFDFSRKKERKKERKGKGKRRKGSRFQQNKALSSELAHNTNTETYQPPRNIEHMIKGILIVNNHGKPRLTKFYQSVTSEETQQSIIRRIFQQVATRPDSFCNYLEGSIPEWGSNIKLIYRHYATLFFVFAVDSQESDLGILDLIQVFVEALDKCFENVCELDLIFHADRVHYVLDEIVMGGMVRI